MRKFYYITTIAIALTAYLQSSYIWSLYDNYITNQRIEIDNTLYISIDTELYIRDLISQDIVPTPGKMTTIIPMEDMTPQELDSILRKYPLPNIDEIRKDTDYNIEQLIKEGIIRARGYIYAQIDQDDYFDEGIFLSLEILDSVFISNSENVFPHRFRQYDKDKNIIDQVGNTKLTEFNYTSRLFPIGIEGYQYVQIEVDIPISDFIKEIVLTLVLSICMLVFVLLCLVYQLMVIRNKTKEIVKGEESLNGTIHDLKSPINSVITMLSWFNMTESDPERKKIIRLNNASVKNLVNNIEALLIATRKNKRNLILHRTDIPLSKFIETIDIIKNEISMLYSSKPHTINILNKTPDNTYVYADAMYIENVIRNLIENAIKYSDDNVIITLTLEAQDNMLRVSVADNGWGIAPKYQKKIFKQFFQVPRAEKNQKGYGIGLTQVKHIINEHGGEIKLISDENKGSTFSFTISKH